MLVSFCQRQTFLMMTKTTLLLPPLTPAVGEDGEAAVAVAVDAAGTAVGDADGGGVAGGDPPPRSDANCPSGR
jgi:hypothetical protein